MSVYGRFEATDSKIWLHAAVNGYDVWMSPEGELSEGQLLVKGKEWVDRAISNPSVAVLTVDQAVNALARRASRTL